MRLQTLPLSAHVSGREIAAIVPGLALCGLVALLAHLGQAAEVAVLGSAPLENLVLAILIGTFIRSLVPVPAIFDRGIGFSAKTLLNIAIVLLGSSISLQQIGVAGPLLVVGTMCVVALAISISYLIGRIMGLRPKLAALVACGNSICGNSAIAAAAPVIRAEASDVAAAIAFTAVLGVAVVLVLPLTLSLLDLSAPQYGILSGLTVYAVPQVLAAAQPGGIVAVHMGTLVKLLRVMMLGPVLFTLGVLFSREEAEGQGARLPLGMIAPWFIIGFAIMMLCRSFGMLPTGMVEDMAVLSNLLTVLSMAALGLGVDIRSLSHASGRVLAAAAVSVVCLAGIALGLIAFLPA